MGEQDPRQPNPPPDASAPPPDEPRYASRGALKLLHALDAFALEVRGRVCADLGCSTGGFTDALLRRGAARVYAVDTAYGQLDYRLRTDPRVVVRERENALHAEPPPPGEGPSLVVVDLSWTRQALAVPAALRWLERCDGAHPPRIITLIKPHYEIDKAAFEAEADKGVLPPERAERVARAVCDSMGSLGAEVLGLTPSPVLGGAIGGKRGRKRGGKAKGAGNIEFLALLAPTQRDRP